MVQYRQQLIRDRGGNPFDEMTLPEAILVLKQGVGRLIRTKTGRGVVAIQNPSENNKMKTYTFHISLPGTGRVWRKIEMRADQTLEELHFAIQRAYEWDCDHLYSFFMSGKAWDESTEYRLPEGVAPWGEPVDDDDEEEEEEEEDWPEPTPEEREQALRALFGETDMTLEEMQAQMDAFWEEILAEEYEGPGNVQTTTLGELDLQPKQEFLYLFDYGDEWRFKVRVYAINPDAPEGKYPRIVESVGEAPEQYPDWG